MTRAVRFWNLIANHYAKSPVPNENLYQKKLSRTQNHMNAASKVLEFGCGTGSTALIHAPKVARYEALDTSSNMIKIAERKANTPQDNARDLSNLKFILGAIEDFKSSDNEYDIILGLSILHLLASPEAAIKKVHRLLKPSGIFITSTVCTTDTMPTFKYIAPILGAIGMPRVTAFGAHELESLINEQGFQTLEEIKPKSKNEALFLISQKI